MLIYFINRKLNVKGNVPVKKCTRWKPVTVPTALSQFAPCLTWVPQSIPARCKLRIGGLQLIHGLMRIAFTYAAQKNPLRCALELANHMIF